MNSLGRLQYTRLPQGTPPVLSSFTICLLQMLRNVHDAALAYAESLAISSDAGASHAYQRVLKHVLYAQKGKAILNLKISHWGGQREVLTLGFFILVYGLFYPTAHVIFHGRPARAAPPKPSACCPLLGCCIRPAYTERSQFQQLSGPFPAPNLADLPHNLSQSVTKY